MATSETDGRLHYLHQKLSEAIRGSMFASARQAIGLVRSALRVGFIDTQSTAPSCRTLTDDETGEFGEAIWELFLHVHDFRHEE